MVSFKVFCRRFLPSASLAFIIGLALVEIAAAQTPPAAPQNIWSHEKAKNEVQISWSKSLSSTNYSIYEWENNNWEPVAAISETQALSNALAVGLNQDLRLIEVSGLECGINYQFVVGASNEHGESGPSPELSTSTLLCDPINVPVLVTPSNGVTVTTNQALTLQWHNGSLDPVDGYYFEVYGPGGHVTQGFTIYEEKAIGKLYPGSYTWKVQSERNDIKGNWSEDFRINVVTYDDPNLEAPMPVSPFNGEVVLPRQIQLSWTSSVQERWGFYYEVWSGDKMVRSRFVTETVDSIGDLDPGLYNWKLLVETPLARSGWSETANFEVKEEIPESPMLISPISGTVVFSGTDMALKWEDVSADAYWLTVQGQGNDFLIQKYITNTADYTLSGMFPGEYKWWVQAEKNGVQGDFSEVWSFMVDLELDPVVDCNTWVGSQSVRVFFETNCSGEYQELPLGKTNLEDVGMDNSVSSIFIPGGLSMRVYWDANQQGLSSCYAQSMWNLGTDYYWQTDQVVGNSISSVEVFDNSNCTTVGEPPTIRLRISLPFLTK